MPVQGQIYRIDPKDLDKNVAVGIALPFNGPRVFTNTYSTKEQAKFNLINVLLTNRGERVMNPDFGSDVRRYIFEFITEENMEGLKSLIVNSIETFVPEVVLLNVEVNPEPDFNTIEIKVNYQMRLSGDKDTVTISFE